MTINEINILNLKKSETLKASQDSIENKINVDNVFSFADYNTNPFNTSIKELYEKNVETTNKKLRVEIPKDTSQKLDFDTTNELVVPIGSNISINSSFMSDKNSMGSIKITGINTEYEYSINNVRFFINKQYRVIQKIFLSHLLLSQIL